MVKIKVKGWIFNIEDINEMYEYYLKMLDSKDISIGIDDIKKLEFDIEKTFIKMKQTQDNIFKDERLETEEEAKQALGKEFIDEFENIRKKCDLDGITLAIHGTTPKTAELIQKDGLLAKTTNYCDTMVTQSSTDKLPVYNDYSGLLNWEHKRYKGLVLIGIPKDCLTLDSKKRKPLWEIRNTEYTDTGFNDLNYRVRPEFIIGYLDIDKRQIIQNDLYMVQHNYEGLINDTTDENLIVETHNNNINATQTNEKNSFIGVPFPEELDESMINRRFRNYVEYMQYCLAMTKRNIEYAESCGNYLKLQNGNIAIPPISEMGDVVKEMYEPVKKLEEDVVFSYFEENLEEIINDTATHEVNQTTRMLAELTKDDIELDNDEIIL